MERTRRSLKFSFSIQIIACHSIGHRLSNIHWYCEHKIAGLCGTLHNITRINVLSSIESGYELIISPLIGSYERNSSIMEIRLYCAIEHGKSGIKRRCCLNEAQNFQNISGIPAVHVSFMMFF